MTATTTDHQARAPTKDFPGLADLATADLPLFEIIEMQGEIADKMASSAPLRDTLNCIALAIERLAPPALCTILLLRTDGRHLRPAAAPSLPEAYRQAVDGIEIGPVAGSCGTAAFLKRPVIVSDIATDPLWEGPREFVLSFGLRACWSMPIIRHDGVVLGTIAMYYREKRAPSAREWGLLAPAARLVRLALAQARKEEELSESEARWHLAADSTGIGTYDVDTTSHVGAWSPRFRAILGLPADAPADRARFLELIHPDDRDRFNTRSTEHPDPPAGRLRDLELRIARADDGEERIVVLKGRHLFNAEGARTRAIGTLCDITEQRQYEKRLAAAKTEAEDASRAKSNFLASMSHELRTPLNAIIGFSDLIRQCTLGPIAPAKYREYVDDIHKSGLHLLSLINDVLDMAKIESGKYQLDTREVAVAPTAEAALRFVEPQAKAAGVALELEIERGLMLMADERALTQVLVNLLSNGVKFTKPGGHVLVFASRLPSGSAVVGVADTGIGMTEEGLSSALEPYGQVMQMDTVDGRGTGLGLPLVKAMIKAHGAQFKIQSEPGRGTRAWAEFPAASVKAARAVA